MWAWKDGDLPFRQNIIYLFHSATKLKENVSVKFNNATVQMSEGNTRQAENENGNLGRKHSWRRNQLKGF